jgi:flagellar export protein FliJ
MGPSFRFRLERVRAVRERREKLAQLELAESITRLSDTQADLRSAEADVEQARAEARNAGASGPVGAAELLANQVFLERVEAEQNQRKVELARSEAEVADRNAKLAAAAGEHEMLIRLRERRRGEHNRELARRESIAHDEIASLRFGRTA